MVRIVKILIAVVYTVIIYKICDQAQINIQ